MGNATSWLVENLGSGMTYYYRVRGIFPDQNSTTSNVITVTTVRVVGEKKWEFQASGSISGRVAISDQGDVLFSSQDGYLYSVDGSFGFLNW